MDKEYTEWDFDMDYYESLSEEEKKKLGEKAQAIFNSDKSPLNFMIKSSGSVKILSKKHWWSRKYE